MSIEASGFPEINVAPPRPAVTQLAQKALLRIKAEYGPNGREPKSYHGVEHTLWVMHAGYRLALLAVQNGNMPPEQADLALIKGAYHDSVHESQPDDEIKSANLAVTDMQEIGVFSLAEALLVKDGIWATTVKAIVDDRIIQAVEGRGYQGMLMADADLSSFGAPVGVYWDSAQRFFEETNPGVPLRGEVFREFAQRQIRVVSKHQFHTQEARQLYNHKPEIIQFLTDQLAAF